VRVSFRTRDLVVASWSIAPEDAERLLPPGLEPAAVDGRYLISVAAIGNTAYFDVKTRASSVSLWRSGLV